MNKHRRKWIWLFVLGIVLLAVFNGLKKRKVLAGLGKAKIALVPITGVIVTGESSTGGVFFSSTTGSNSIVGTLKQIRKRKDIRGVILRMNTPGGTVAGAQEIYQEVQKLKKKGKKVVVSMADLCASGGYYIASAADYIFASPGSLTGSIGALIMLQKMKELYNKIGIDMEVIKSGKYKDIGSPFRDMEEDERRIMKKMILDVYDQFVSDVARGRKMKRNKVVALADGRIYTGRQALKQGLVDELGGLEDAIAYIAKATGIKGEPFIEKYEQPKSPWRMLLGSFKKDLSFSYPLIMYLYVPKL